MKFTKTRKPTPQEYKQFLICVSKLIEAHFSYEERSLNDVATEFENSTFFVIENYQSDEFNGKILVAVHKIDEYEIYLFHPDGTVEASETNASLFNPYNC